MVRARVSETETRGPVMQASGRADRCTGTSRTLSGPPSCLLSSRYSSHFLCLVADAPRFVCAEGLTGEGLHRADVHALPAFAAAFFHGLARRKGRVGEDGDPTHAGADLGRHEQAALSDPAQAGEMRGELVGEDRAMSFDVGSVGGRDGHGAMAGALEQAGDLRGGLIEALVDDVVGVTAVLHGHRVLTPIRQLIHDGAGSAIPMEMARGKAATISPPCSSTKRARQGEIGDADEIALRGGNQIGNFGVEIHNSAPIRHGTSPDRADLPALRNRTRGAFPRLTPPVPAPILASKYTRGGGCHGQETDSEGVSEQAHDRGGGGALRRAFGFEEVEQFDPFLLLDDFRATSPAAYLPGFPWHPHRGIETITYVLTGRVEHGDSMGNSGVIGEGDIQWMTAGNGIIHQEMPKGRADGVMGGFQLWANLPSSHKMMEPRYRGLTSEEIPEVGVEGGAGEGGRGASGRRAGTGAGHPD